MKSIITIVALAMYMLAFSQEIQSFKTSNYEIKVNSSKMSYNEAKQFCKGQNYFLGSERSVQLVVGSYGAQINSNTFWTDKEVYMSSNNVDHANKIIDYDAANVYYRDKNTFNPETKSNTHGVICTKEIVDNVEGAKSILNSSIQLGSIKVYPKSVSSMTLDQAKAFCQGLGAGWRLPTIDELQTIKQSNIIAIDNLTQPFYWSGSKSCDGCYTSYFALRMDNSVKIAFETTSALRFIPVYSAESTTSLIQTWNFGSYEVTTQFFGPMTISEAISYCMKATDNPNKPWRVTTMQELSSMKAYKSEIQGMIGKRFFSYENKSQVFNRSDLNVVKIEPVGYNETWVSGSEETRGYFFMARRK